MSTQAARRRALKRANEVRSTRARIKRQIAAGDLQADALLEGKAAELGDLLTEIQEHAEQMKVGELVQAIAGVGPDTAAEILGGVASDCRLYRLEAERRAEIAAEIRRLT